MPVADDWARAPEDDHPEWPPADGADGEAREEKAPTARGFFLGQLADGEPVDEWADECPDDVRADDPRDRGEEEGGDFDLAPLTFETELYDPVPTDDDATELSLASGIDEPTRVAIGAVPPLGARQALRAARKRRGRARLSRAALVAGVVAALAGGTAVYVGTHAKADDQSARRPTSTSVERPSSSTTVTSASSTVAAPGTEPPPDSAAVPGSSAPASPQRTSSAPGAAPGSATPTSPRAPGSTATPPNSASPPSAPPPQSPMCQLLPVVCR
jgi:hypothetical protein